MEQNLSETRHKTCEKQEKQVTSDSSNNDLPNDTLVTKATIGAEKHASAASDRKLLTTVTKDGADVTIEAHAPSANDVCATDVVGRTRSQCISAFSSYSHEPPDDTSEIEEQGSRDKSFSVCDAQLGAVAQLVDIVNDLEKAHDAHAQIEREKRARRLHNLLEPSPSIEDLPASVKMKLDDEQADESILNDDT